MSDYSAFRRNMVDTQVRTNDVTDQRIHAAMREIPRERFVPAIKRAVAYSDACVEVAPGRYLLDPRTLAKLIQLAEVRPDDRILDVGCATGYSAAVLGRLATSVFALEQDADLVRVATEALLATAARNVTVVQGALIEGLKPKAPFDVIFVNGAIQNTPDNLLGQLAEGGRLVAIVQPGTQGRAELFLKQNGRVGGRPDFDSTVPMLAGFKKAVGFVF
jgi:protein-L-isoaspartate(D-aspartate) O-methyltransferase